MKLMYILAFIQLAPVRLTQLIRQFNARRVLDQVLRNPDAARSNVASRKCWVNFDELQNLSKDSAKSSDGETANEMPARLLNLVRALPNWTHESVRNAEAPVVLDEIGTKPETKTRRMVENAKGGGLLLQNAEYTMICGDRTYFLTGDLVRVERALIKFTLDRLLRRGFRLVSVPDLVRADEIEACGMDAKGKRSQIYRVNIADGKQKLCLSGTAEMALANLFKGQDIRECHHSCCFIIDILISV